MSVGPELRGMIADVLNLSWKNEYVYSLNFKCEVSIFIIIYVGNVFLDQHSSYKFIIMTFISLIFYFPHNYILMF